MSLDVKALHGLNSRGWYVEDGVHPKRVPVPLGNGKFTDPSHTKGERGRIAIPDPDNYEGDIEIGTTPGSTERATFGLSARFLVSLSDLLRLFRRNCRIDVYALMGKCKNPEDFTYGWEKIVFFPDADFTSHNFENFGAYSTDEAEAINENTELTAREYYEIGQESFDELAADLTVREVMTIDVCDTQACGECDYSSDGCQRVLATMAGTGATPGTLPLLLYSADHGETWNTQNITTMFSTEAPDDAECVGGLFVVVSGGAHELHYTNLDDLYNGVNIWYQTDIGFVAGGEPRAIWSVGPRHTWIVGDGGYIYFTSSPAGGVTVQDAGVATTQDLQDVHAFDKKHILAVGDLNAVVYSKNGGKTWQTVTGPDAGITMNCCWMWNKETWFVGSSTGELWLTTNSGLTWERVGADFESSIPVELAEIFDIRFVDEAEGYIAANVGVNGRILRTITAGNDWVVLPNGSGAPIPANDHINDLAVCLPGSNVVFGAGLDDDAATGVIVKAEA